VTARAEPAIVGTAAPSGLYAWWVMVVLTLTQGRALGATALKPILRDSA